MCTHAGSFIFLYCVTLIKVKIFSNWFLKWLWNKKTKRKGKNLPPSVRPRAQSLLFLFSPLGPALAPQPISLSGPAFSSSHLSQWAEPNSRRALPSLLPPLTTGSRFLPSLTPRAHWSVSSSHFPSSSPSRPWVGLLPWQRTPCFSGLLAQARTESL